ncbi:DUF3820 family protein [Spirochaeta africana]|nr:DUF3820 family protein [Spirochaeta africana]
MDRWPAADAAATSQVCPEQQLYRLANTVMPFGKYAGTHLVNLPESYVLWFQQNGWPEGEIGRQLAAIAEIKANGLEYLLRPLIGRG